MKETQAWDIRGRTGREGGCEREVWWRGGHERNEARVPRKHLSSSRSRSLSAAAAVFPWTFAILSARFRLILAPPSSSPYLIGIPALSRSLAQFVPHCGTAPGVGRTVTRTTIKPPCLPMYSASAASSLSLDLHQELLHVVERAVVGRRRQTQQMRQQRVDVEIAHGRRALEALLEAAAIGHKGRRH